MSIRCPQCESKKIFYLRIDSDWAAGVGEYHPINDRSEYTDEEWVKTALDRPDIELFHCPKCCLLFQEDIFNEEV